MSHARVDTCALNSSLRRLAEQGEDSDLYVSLQRVIDASEQLFAVSGGGLMLADEHAELRYVVASSGPSQVMEEVQIQTGEGPCVDAYVHDHVNISADLATDERYRAAAPLITAEGIAAVLAVPIHLSALTVGSLDIYVDRPYEFDQSEVDAMTRYGEVVEATLHAAVTASHSGQLADQLAYALEYRTPIERGIGYLMHRDQLDHAEAFAKLRSAARSSRRKIDEVASQLLATGQLPGETDTPNTGARSR
jgi:transcriptional regulator with GAF, ATPase, and Fis domain